MAGRLGLTVSCKFLQHDVTTTATFAHLRVVADSSASNHMTPYAGNISLFRPPNFAIPSSIVVGNESILPVTSVGDTVLPDPFYVNNVLVTFEIIKDLLFVRQFTIDNSCSMKFNPFGLFVKDLATRKRDHQVQ
jgi:hypothetical protein